ncbi:hypothetical protein [Mesorhizobium sp. YR577]|uniref:hypothetical protein n=1 Tax=Mesorhizobium sp. YR577 TaxID=1884373 RepID=UPI0008E702CF|nr:hypothetical protein [Mesorhizobium sp. YR577]SFU09524.1 hypothetical protein SAMN05518861_112140 [Mesorhizobium sp. YR577]
MPDGDFFSRVADAARHNSTVVLNRLLPAGTLKGREYVALNPNRSDSKPGSFKINIDTGRWADFATNDHGGDLISLTAYLYRMRQLEAAERLADMLGVRK